MGNVVCGRCSVGQIIKFIYFILYIYRHLKLEIPLAIAASNE